MAETAERLLSLCRELPSTYVDEVVARAPLERAFRDTEKHWYSPFILFSVHDVELCAHDTSKDPALAGFFSIGSNGGMETYYLKIADGSIWVADPISPDDSLHQVAASFDDLVASLDDPAEPQGQADED